MIVPDLPRCCLAICAPHVDAKLAQVESPVVLPGP